MAQADLYLRFEAVKINRRRFKFSAPARRPEYFDSRPFSLKKPGQFILQACTDICGRICAFLPTVG